MTAIELNRRTLAALPASVQVPAYDPAAVAPGIVHLGLGGFHRAHMARYTHDLMERRPDALRWGILGAGLLPGDRAMEQALAPQDGLYTLVERSGEAETVTVIGALAGVLFAGESSATLLAAMQDPAIRIVSLTVTENGYCLNRATKRLDPEHPAIRQDLATPEAPRSAIGILVEGFRRRRAAGLPPFTALTCDNIQHNGEVLRQAVLDLAEARDPALAAWIRAEVAFPNTMVDRITPVTQPGQVEELRARHGIADRWPVFAETFRQWVIEDRFPQGRPAWEEVGAQFVADVAPYEFMKLRLLNASHLAIAGLGRLAGHVTIDETMADPLFRAYMAALMDRETGPTLPPVPGIDLADYKRTLIERFANTAIRDTVERVNTDAPINVLVDPIRDRLRMGGDVGLLALALAAWFRRVRGEDEQGAPIEVKHPLAALLREKAIEGGPDPAPLLGIRPLFGELADDTRLAAAVGHWLGSLYAVGSLETLRRAAREAGF
ncbi:mannitol dehydrogenase family protein [Paracraurococcus lichenis]|uniref:Mannitol dehydrogenase family protein n=1 Tax=Paracraurococcus lichenis TaxID=3064888 RepID=A0ABT9DW96_9PROT|nr:mannitol dehydrogenase family protein [Paracraurococcus sp. LOR1-02]MDO9708169.1 mannitol dehydrogenase family protein [Paracraurococcus sp. LOR1-02]